MYKKLPKINTSNNKQLVLIFGGHKMKAIIMAGGEGLRLRPLTCSIPKPMAEICGKTTIEYILDLLKKHKFTNATLAVRYKGDRLLDFLGSEYKSLALEYSFEESPLGTAGSVLKANPNENDINEDILVISGDAVCDFDLTEAIKFHKEHNSIATIITREVSDPREYGLVFAENGGRITSFLEKPSYESCVTNLANTGVYILSSDVLKLIPENTESDFAKDIFPIILKNGMPIFSYEENGYWCDIGDFNSYIKCQKDLLGGAVDCEINGHRTLDNIITNSPSEFKGSRLTAPIYIGKNVNIARGVIIDKGSVISDNVTICRGAKIHGSVILNGAYIGERCTCNESVICGNVKLLAGASVYEGAVIGENSTIGENAVVESSVKIWMNKQIASNAVVSYDVKYGNVRKLALDEDGLSGETNSEITPSIAAILGASASLIGKRIGIGFSLGQASEAMSFAVMSGALSAGVNCYNLGECTEPQLDFLLNELNLNGGVYISAGVTTKLKIFGEGGLPLYRVEERKLESGLNRHEYTKSGFSEFGKAEWVLDLKSIYIHRLTLIAKTAIKGIRVEVASSNLEIKKIAEKILEPINDLDGNKLTFHISSDGRRISAYSLETGHIFHEKLMLICCLDYFQRGLPVSIPYSELAIADILAKDLKAVLLRYYNCPFDDSDKEARKLAKTVTFPRDGLEILCRIVEIISSKEVSLKDLESSLPAFTTANRFLSIEKSPADVLKSLCKVNAGLGEGIVTDDKGSRVLIRPVKTGRGVMMFVESFKNETAAELCDIYEKKLNQGCGAAQTIPPRLD